MTSTVTIPHESCVKNRRARPMINSPNHKNGSSSKMYILEKEADPDPRRRIGLSVVCTNVSVCGKALPYAPNRDLTAPEPHVFVKQKFVHCNDGMASY